MDFRNYGLRKTWLDKSRKNAVSGYPLTSYMGNAPKHCRNLNDGSFTMFFDHYESN